MRSSLRIHLLAIWCISLALSACAPQAKSVSEENAAFIYTSAAQTAAVQTPLLATTLPVYPTDTLDLTLASTALFFSTPTSYAEYPTAAVASSCDNSAFVADVTFPDNTVVAPDAPFGKTWSFENNGSCTWDDTYRLTFTSGEAMDGNTTAITGTVAPGDTTDITVPMVSPSVDGTYTGYWQMMNSDGELFGVVVYVLIQVSSSVTSTPTLTATGNTATPTPSFTSTATGTPLPTSTPSGATATPTPSPSGTAMGTSLPTPTPTPLATAS